MIDISTKVYIETNTQNWIFAVLDIGFIFTKTFFGLFDLAKTCLTFLQKQ